MKIHSKSGTPARARWAAVAVLSLLAAGLPSSALASSGDRASFADRIATPAKPSRADRAAASATPSAEGGVSIKGTVLIPAGIDPGTEMYADSYYYDEADEEWELGEYVSLDPTGDGTFEIPDLEAGEEYRLAVYIDADGYFGGFYAGAGKPIVPTAEEGVPVFAPSSGYVFGPVVASSISGTFSVPEGFDWGLGGFEILAGALSPDGQGLLDFSGTPVTEASNGTFVLDYLWPGRHFIVGAVDDQSRFPGGGYHAGVDGLVALEMDSTPVIAGSTVHLEIRSTHAVPKLTAVTAPQLGGSAVVGEKLSTTPGSWSVVGVAVAYQWLRDGVAVPGATTPSYGVTREDIGSRIAVRVTGAREGFPNTAVTSASTAVVPRLAAPLATKAPAIKGTARFGKTLRATAGSWSLAGAKVSYQWLRDGKAIKGATSAKYTLKKKDVRKRVSVRVTASLAGHLDGVAASSSKKVAKAKPKVTLKAKKKIKAGQRAKLVVKVKASGVARPKGTVIVKYGKKTIKVKLTAKSKGKVVVRLPELAKGKYKVTATYKPAAKAKKYVAKAKSTKVTLRVR